ncbi:hypothetical protein D9M71_784930 [compost metagenome]
MHALVIETELERCLLVGPVGLLEAQADLLVVGEFHFAEFRRQIAGRSLVLLAGEFLGLLADIVQVECPGLAGAQRQECGAKQQPLEEFARSS